MRILVLLLSAVFAGSVEAVVQPSQWERADCSWGGVGCVAPENVTFGDGRAVLKADAATKRGAALVSKDYLHYGSYRVKAKVPSVLGLCSAFWTYRHEEYGRLKVNHEIDIELPGRLGEPLKDIGYRHALMNTWTGEAANEHVIGYTDLGTSVADGKVHEFRFDWRPDRVEFFVDGKLLRTSKEHVPTLPSKMWIGVWFPDKWAGEVNFQRAEMEVLDFSFAPFHNVLPPIVGVWEHSGCGLHKGDWKRTVAELAGKGITDLFVNFAWPDKVREDMIEPCLAAAHAAGMRVHCWLCCFAEKHKKLEHLDPADREVRKRIVALAEKLAKDHAFDGIHFDYVRFEDGAKDVKPSAVEEFVAAASERVRKARPGILVTAAVYPEYPYCRDGVGQNWNRWLDKGYVDYAVPMAYTLDSDAFRRNCKEYARHPVRGARTVAGIGVTSNVGELDASGVRRQLRMATESGFPGVCFFDLDRYFVDNILPVLTPAAGGTLTALAPANGAKVSVHRKEFKEWLLQPREVRRKDMVDKERRKWMHQKVGFLPEPVLLEWRGGNGTYEVTVKRVRDGKTVLRETTDETFFEVWNLEIATEYAWQVTSGEERVRGRFVTEDFAPRQMRWDNVPNVRDLGGRIGLGGRRIRQGRIFRSEGMNRNASHEELKDANGKVTNTVSTAGAIRLTESAVFYCTNSLGIRTDIDLRSDGECWGMTGSPLGPNAKWVHLSSWAYGGFGDPKGKKRFAETFRVFLDEANYPIDFHCIAGADRTGSVACVLEGLLGASDEEIIRDWEITAFRSETPGFNHEERFDKLIKVFSKFPGKTLAERIEHYVLSLGFTPAEIERFRSLMLEEK